MLLKIQSKFAPGNSIYLFLFIFIFQCDAGCNEWIECWMHDPSLAGDKIAHLLSHTFTEATEDQV